MIVKVTREDIECGKPGNGRRCPVALAIDRATQKTDVLVMSDAITVNGRRYSTPSRVAAWTRRFDLGEPVRPFEFDLPD